MGLRIPNPYIVFGFGGLILLASVLYNTGLAFLNANIMPVGTLHVALTEAVILAIAAVYLASKIRAFPGSMIMPAVVFLVFMGMMFLLVSFLNEHLYPKAIRDMILVAVFFMIGGTASGRGIFASFRFLAAAILLFIVIEACMTEFYVMLFEPAEYYANTRGIQKLEDDKTGLFRNSLGYAGRFSFGIFETHRLSSVFLEQVSLANFAVILAIFLATFWGRLSWADRVLYAVTILMIILTNNSRTASVLCAMIAAGYFIFPYLPRYTHMLYMPAALLCAWLFFYDPEMGVRLESDDLTGRIGHTMANLSTMKDAYYTGGTIDEIYRMFDSGFTYLIMTQTVFGLLAFWLFTGLAVPSSGAVSKRFNHSLMLYLYLNMLTSSAIFSIKVSAPLFFMAGYLHYEWFRKREEA